MISREILEGMAYMHHEKVIHRDLKPENIVLIHVKLFNNSGFSKNM